MWNIWVDWERLVQVQGVLLLLKLILQRRGVFVRSMGVWVKGDLAIDVAGLSFECGRVVLLVDIRTQGTGHLNHLRGILNSGRHGCGGGEMKVSEGGGVLEARSQRRAAARIIYIHAWWATWSSTTAVNLSFDVHAQ
jgi:hypothetical protein